MKMQMVRLNLVGILSLFGAGAAIAADYTFVVPVEFRALPPEIREMEMLCVVYTGTAGPTYRQLGEGRERRPVAGGALITEFRVDVTRNPGETRRPTNWQCMASLVAVVAGRTQLYIPVTIGPSRPGEYRFNPVFASAPGTPVVIRTAGELR
jgi:hypothetical protein